MMGMQYKTVRDKPHLGTLALMVAHLLGGG